MSNNEADRLAAQIKEYGATAGMPHYWPFSRAVDALAALAKQQAPEATAEPAAVPGDAVGLGKKILRALDQGDGMFDRAGACAAVETLVAMAQPALAGAEVARLNAHVKTMNEEIQRLQNAAHGLPPPACHILRDAYTTGWNDKGMGKDFNAFEVVAALAAQGTQKAGQQASAPQAAGVADLDEERCGPVMLEGELRFRHEFDLHDKPDYRDSLLCKRAEAALDQAPPSAEPLPLGDAVDLLAARKRGAVVVDAGISSIEMDDQSWSVAQVREALYGSNR